MSPARLAIAAAAGVGIQVGAAMVATRIVVDEVTPTTLAFLRYAIGTACLALVLAGRAQRPRFARADLLPIALLGIGQFALLVVLLNHGLRSITAARGAVLFASMPLMTMVLAAALGREALSPAKSLGVGLTILGVAATFGEKLLESRDGAQWLGAIYVLASAFCGALCSVFYRPYLRRYPALEVSGFAMAASTAALLAAAALEGGLGAVASLSTRGWGAVVFIGLSSGVGYVLWLWALANASPTRVTAFLSLGPVAAAVLGYLVLGEQPGPLLLVGLAAVVLGLRTACREPPGTRKGDA